MLCKNFFACFHKFQFSGHYQRQVFVSLQLIYATSKVKNKNGKFSCFKKTNIIQYSLLRLKTLEIKSFKSFPHEDNLSIYQLKTWFNDY